MKEIKEEKTTIKVELTISEVELIKDLTQNALKKETKEQAKIRLSLFVGASRILGFDMADDGSIKRIKYDNNNIHTN